jgi:N-acetyl-anhydromuramyl-L-alanine amidase AmpD
MPANRPAVQPTVANTANTGHARPAAVNAVAALPVVARGRWCSQGIAHLDIDAMNGIQRITVHHEGFQPVYFRDERSTAQRINAVRNAHLARGWADIGYHFIIDREGRIWEGRDLRYQGAHASDQNEHNIGVMLLGNFDRQAPTQAQTSSLQLTLNSLMRSHHVRKNRVFTHQELPRQATSCPGRSLQAHMVTLRRGNRG